MKTVGEILQASREKQKLTQAEVARLTKIQVKFIKALEENKFKELPESTFVKGFIRNYAQTLGKDPNILLAVFRRDFGQDAKGKVVPRGLITPLNQPKLRWTPTITLIASFSALITILLIYLVFQFKILSGAPPLNLKTPQENETVSSLITVEGSTNPQATVKVNSKQITVNEAGDFSETISLPEGTHTITVESISRAGKSKILQRTVIVKP